MMHGALLVDKPEGMTSFDVIRRLKRVLPGVRLGHSGTLDPFATGLLVVLLGKATRLQDLFLGASKSYEGTIALGYETNTDDITGALRGERTSPPPLSRANEIINALLAEFTGEIEQVPPAFSAIKVDGKRSYKLARDDKEVRLSSRKVRIDSLELFYQSEGVLDYRVTCSKGTYIRALARDMGRLLGCGACVSTLRRTASKPFDVSAARSLEQLLALDSSALNQTIISLEELIGEMPRMRLSAEECELLRRGDQRPLSTAGYEALGAKNEEYQGLIAVFEEDKGICAFAQREVSPEAAKAGISIRFVL